MDIRRIIEMLLSGQAQPPTMAPTNFDAGRPPPQYYGGEGDFAVHQGEGPSRGQPRPRRSGINQSAGGGMYQAKQTKYPHRGGTVEQGYHEGGPGKTKYPKRGLTKAGEGGVPKKEAKKKLADDIDDKTMPKKKKKKEKEES